jgi:hypothetical protein
VQAGAESLPQSLAPVPEARRSSEKRPKTRKSTKANLPGVSRTACPARPRLRKPQARSSRKIHQPAKGGLKRTHNALKAPSMGSLRWAKADTLLEMYQPRTTRRDHLYAALPKSNRPMQTACPASHAAHAVIVVVQALPISCIVDDGLQPASSTAESTVFSAVFQAITKMLAVQTCAQHRSKS